jgi:hypothetical protein
LKQIAYVHFPRRLGWLSMGLNSSKLASPRRETARFKESGSPKPLVNSHE